MEVYWSEDELSGTNWESGWYRGEVQLLYMSCMKKRKLNCIAFI